MSVTATPGFVAGGVACGIKASGDRDLALIATADGKPVPAGAVFTSNAMTAAPVLTCRDHLAATGGMAAGVILNSGNANAASGSAGRRAAERMSAVGAAAVGCEPNEMLVRSTGLIGFTLEIDRIEAAQQALADSLSDNGGPIAAESIMTTDTVRKESVVRGDGFVVSGMAKGAAMLAPNMATMLAVLTTDADVAPGEITRSLRAGVGSSFNQLSVDGCTSTNDTVILLASGTAGPVDKAAFDAAVAEVCMDLALAMAGDAEGATKVVKVHVTGAFDDAEAQMAARKIAESQLVKCSWYGKDPYWGRIASEAGSAGVAFDQSLVSITYGDQMIAEHGINHDHDEAALTKYMEQRYIEVTTDLGLGDGRATILTNDLTHAYVDENMGTS